MDWSMGLAYFDRSILTRNLYYFFFIILKSLSDLDNERSSRSKYDEIFLSCVQIRDSEEFLLPHHR